MCYDQYNVDHRAIIGIIEILFDIKVDNFICNNINIMLTKSIYFDQTRIKQNILYLPV